MEAKAHARYVRMSPRKMRRVVDLVRGKGVPEAVNILHFSPQRASIQVEKTLRSAVANFLASEGGKKAGPEDLFIREVFVNEGPTLRRFRPRARGRATRIRKRSSHLTVVVAEKED